MADDVINFTATAKMADGRTLTFTASGVLAQVTAAPAPTTTAPAPAPAPAPTPAPAPAPSTAVYFAADWGWNKPIPATPALSPDSATHAKRMASMGFGVQLNYDSWCPKIVYADASTPLYRVVSSNGIWAMTDVPIPAGAKGTTDSDSHIAIIDKARNKVWDFMGAPTLDVPRYDTLNKEYRVAASFGVYDLDKYGWWDCDALPRGPWVARSSNSSNIAGTIFVDELKAGVIPHALAVCIDVNHLGTTPVPPAKTTDYNGIPGGIPNGSRIQLDPALDLAQFGLGKEAMMIAVALQKYGAYVVDRTNGFAMYLQSKQGMATDPYATMDFKGLIGPAGAWVHQHWRFLAAEAAPVYDSRANHPNMIDLRYA